MAQHCRLKMPETRSRGFTLMELIVVITIIGVLSTIVTAKVVGWLDKAKEIKVTHDLQSIAQTADSIYLRYGAAPSTIEKMVLREDGIGFDEEPLDPWGNRYIYERRGDRAFVLCLGRDNQEGGEGPDADRSYPKARR